MPAVPEAMVSVLASAVKAARAALADLDADDVPHKLRPVVASTGPRLPPPLLEQLITALDAHEWLREAAREHLAGDEAVAAAFLAREPGWTVTVAEAAIAVEAEASQRALDTAQAKLSRLQSRYEVAKQKARAAAEDARAARQQAKQDVAEVKRRALDAARAAAPDPSGRVAALEAELADARRRLDAAVAEAARSAEKLRMERRRRADAERAAEQGGHSLVRDPIGWARHLDALVEVAARAAPQAEERSHSVGPPMLPSGVPPDAGAAFQSLLSDPPGFTLVIDGHNVAGALPGYEVGDPTARRRIDSAAASAVRQARGPVRAVVVYDSSREGERVDTTHRDGAPPGVVVRFAPAGTPADDLVVAAALDADRAVVVSSDRDVRERAETGGALGVWAKAFVEWMA